MTDPIIFSKLDADRILKRAAEIEGSDDSKPLTDAEIRSIAEEAGFGRRAVERAIAEAKRVATAKVLSPPVQKSGRIITHLSTFRTVPVEVDSEQLTRAVRLFQPYKEGPAQVKLEDHQITWRDRKGIQFTVTSAAEVTEIRVYVAKPLMFRGRWIGWVKAAADRLEMLVLMVATQDPPKGGYLSPGPETPGREG
jgi:hypothetical protein